MTWSYSMSKAGQSDGGDELRQKRTNGSMVCFMPPVAPSGVLVGRNSELAMLVGLVKSLTARRGGSVLVEGEPGIGKTALVQAALASVPKGGFRVFWGAGDELGQALPLLPFLDALRVREPSGDPRRVTIVRLLRGEIATLHAADGAAVLAEQL